MGDRLLRRAGSEGAVPGIGTRRTPRVLNVDRTSDDRIRLGSIFIVRAPVHIAATAIAVPVHNTLSGDLWAFEMANSTRTTSELESGPFGTGNHTRRRKR